MKTYVQNSLEDDKYKLAIQYEKLDLQKIKDLAMSSYIVKYEIPAKQSLNCTWILRLHFNNEASIEISALCTNIGGWQEMGSLKIRLCDTSSSLKKNENLFITKNIEKFCSSKLSLITFNDESVYAECGIIFSNDVGGELIVATSPAPGAVTVRIPSEVNEFQPEILLSDCQKVIL
ncbi:MAG: hypothetical protein ACI8WB_002340 [Phenylobacterium sp.]|jgi:hypothetical protein